MLPIGRAQQILDRRDARVVGRPAAALPDLPVERLDLVLARFDHQPDQIIGIGQAPQFREAGALVLARLEAQVETHRIVELPAGRVRRRLGCQRRGRAELGGTQTRQQAREREAGGSRHPGFLGKGRKRKARRGASRGGRNSNDEDFLSDHSDWIKNI
jgi:hypothetical protein